MTGPTIVVTVPDLVPDGPTSGPTSPASADAAVASASRAVVAESVSSLPAQAVPPPSEAVAPPPSPAPAPAETAAAEPTQQPTAPPATEAAERPAPTTATGGDGLNVSLANCDGCTVLATHRDVTADLSAALVGTGSRAILLSVMSDGATAGVIGVPYGAAFPEPDGGLLACAEGRCIVEGRQLDGRAVLAAFELTDTGAWRDVSGDDAFPSATERGAVVDLGGSLGIAVQDQGDGGAVWLLYTWTGDRYVVVGCAPDGPVPTAADAVSPDTCLS